ncbi:MAG: hypothetical protein QOD42_3416, partial [Sphingomonadales bacterium]|nr:hypothetical protein [Sphingomonadales bacterium]
MKAQSDILIVGAGHNALVCAFYLAERGLEVTMVESRSVVGGAAVTEEFHPGFRNSTASYTVSLLNPRVISDMRLYEHGLKVVLRKIDNFLPTLGPDYLLSGRGGLTKSEIARHSPADAGHYDAYAEALNGVVAVLRQWLLRAPPNAGGGLGDLFALLKLGGGVGRLGLEQQRHLIDFFTKSAADVLQRYFSHDLVQALFGFDAVVGHYASPFAPGSAYVLLHHVFGEAAGVEGAWGHAIGGMGAITQAMAKAAEGAGAKISLSSPVREVVVERGRACGVVLADGAIARAKAIVANVNPKLLYEKLVPEDALTPDFRARMGAYRCESATFRMNVALSELPRFSVLPGAGDHHTAGIIIAPSLRYMDRAYAQARLHGWSTQPIIEMLIPSTLDDTLAPKGAHVASLFCQHTAYDLQDRTSQGRTWDACRDEVADLMIA